MFAVIFEVTPRPERWDQYLKIAGVLRPEIERIDGFIDNERFTSQRQSGRLLSLSTWRDEKALIRWRTLAVHHRAQEQGRNEVFLDYHLRVGQVTADTHPPAGHVLREQRLDATEVEASFVTITEAPAGGDPPLADRADALDHDVYESITTPGKRLLLAAWSDAAGAWHPASGDGVRHRVVRVIRAYGMFDRREAPQYYPEVARG